MTLSKETHNLDLPSGLSILSGIIILATSSLFYAMHMGLPGMAGMMGSYWEGTYMTYYMINGSVCGGIIIFGGYMMHEKPFDIHRWGWIVLIISALSLFEMLGAFIGPVLGIIGGVIAITRGRRIQQLR